jgi:hypothetical protein
VPSRKASIAWRTEDDSSNNGRFHMFWCENGDPEVLPPNRHGSGHEGCCRLKGPIELSTRAQFCVGSWSKSSIRLEMLGFPLTTRCSLDQIRMRSIKKFRGEWNKIAGHYFVDRLLMLQMGDCLGRTQYDKPST